MRIPRTALAALLAFSLLPGLLVLWILWLAPIPPEALDGADRAARAMRGFSNMWAAGTAVNGGMTGLLFDQPAYAAWVRELFGRGMPEQMWGYPPHALFLAVAAASLPIGVAYAAWLVLTHLGLWAALRRAGLAPAVAAAALLSPAVLEDILSGQNGAITGALLVAGLLLARDRPWLSGVMFGLLTIKPQLGVLIPVAMLASRNWRAIFAAALTTAVLVAASSFAFGAESWVRFLTDTREFMSQVLARPWTDAPSQRNFASPLVAFRAIGAPDTLAWALQITISVACAALAWIAWSRRHADPAMRLALTAALGVLAVPYSHNYDLVALATGIALLGARLQQRGGHPGEWAALSLAWTWPGVMILVPAVAPPVAAASITAVAWMAWRRLSLGSDGHPSKESRGRDRIEGNLAPDTAARSTRDHGDCQP